MEGLNDLQQAVLNKLLSGDHPVLNALRVQAAKACLVKQEYTGVGFFCNFEVPSEAPILRGDFEISDVNAEIEGLTNGAGFVLFISNGQLDMLEGFSYDEPWVQTAGGFNLTYLNEPRELSFPDVL